MGRPTQVGCDRRQLNLYPAHVGSSHKFVPHHVQFISYYSMLKYSVKDDGIFNIIHKKDGIFPDKDK